MFSDIAPTKGLSIPQLPRSRLRAISEQFPTVGDVRRALDRDLLRIPTVSRGTVRRLREALDVRNRETELEAALTAIRDLLPITQDEYSRRVFATAADALEPSA